MLDGIFVHMYYIRVSTNLLMTQNNEINSLKAQVRELQQSLAEKEMAFESILENTNAGYWDWNIQKKSMYVSDTFNKMFGQNENKSDASTPPWQLHLHPDDQDKVLEIYKQHVNSHGDFPFQFEAKYLHADGSLVWVWSKGSVIEWDSENNPIRIIGSHINITPVKTISNLFEEVQNLANIGVWIVDVQAKKVFWSDEVYRIHEVEIGSEISLEDGINYYHDDYKEVIRESVNKGIEENGTWDLEAKIVTTTGKEKWVRAIGFPVIKNGEVSELRGMFADIDVSTKHRIKLEKALEQIQAEKKRAEQFAYITSHDLQEPLTTISSIVKLIEDELEHSETGKKHPRVVEEFGMIKQASLRMKNLINDLFDFSRIGTSSNLQPVNLNDLISEILSDLKDLIEENQVVLEIDSLPTMHGYSEELKILFTHLVTNAIKFRSPKRNPKISISSASIQGGYHFQIKDNGIGIDGKYKDKIFKIFQRLHSKDEFEGTGIGLAHCKKIVDLHHGMIDFSSEIGEGTTFSFTLMNLNQMNIHQ